MVKCVTEVTQQLDVDVVGGLWLSQSAYWSITE